VIYIIHTSGIDRVIALLDSDLDVIAVGSGATANLNDTQLPSEFFRKLTQVGVVDGNVLIKEIFLDESEANGNITSIGILGSGATATAGTGQLFASGPAALLKDNTQSLTISFEIEVKEVVV
jgi:hypothetical protein